MLFRNVIMTPHTGYGIIRDRMFLGAGCETNWELRPEPRLTWPRSASQSSPRPPPPRSRAPASVDIFGDHNFLDEYFYWLFCRNQKGLLWLRMRIPASASVEFQGLLQVLFMTLMHVVYNINGCRYPPAQQLVFVVLDHLTFAYPGHW